MNSIYLQSITLTFLKLQQSLMTDLETAEISRWISLLAFAADYQI